MLHTQEIKKNTKSWTLNHRWLLVKVHKVIKFNQKSWLKSYVGINTELRQYAKIILKKTFSSW